MENELDIESPKRITGKQLATFAIIGFVLVIASGIAIGYMIGGYVMQQEWIEYNEKHQEMIERNCICINKTEMKPEYKYDFQVGGLKNE